tara:strand:+ start:427 stop:1839 length:1413 start_codon:yes stop_codon:yes gene_type:complete
MVAQLASGSYYDFSLIVIGIGIPAILLFLIFLSLDPKKSLFLFILIFPIFPSIHNYLSTFGSKLVPALIELVISFLLFFAISIKHKSSRQLNSITYFSIFWVFANSVSLMISGFEEPALVGYILSLAFLFMALSLSKAFSILRSNETLRFYDRPIFIFSISLAFYIFACILLLLSSYGSEVFATITKLQRLDEFDGMAYLDINAMSGISLLLVPLSLFYLTINRQLITKAINVILIFLVVLLVFIDKSRGGLLCFIFLVGWLIFTNLLPNLNKTYSQSGSRLISLGLFSLVGLTSIYLIGDIIFFRFSGTDEGAAAVTIADVVVRTFVSTRGQLLIEGFTKFFESPVFGHGYGTMLYVATIDVNWDSHNQILESLISIGLFGTSSLFYLLMSSYMRYRKNKKFMDSKTLNLQKNIWLSIILFGLFGLTTGMHLIDTSDRVSFFPIYLYSFFIILSMHISEESKISFDNNS